MSATDPGTWVDRLLRTCVSLFAAALALHFAVQLIASVWTWLVAIGLVVALALAAALMLRRLLGGW